MSKTYDFAIIGGGIAGVAIGHELAAFGSVCLLKRETQLAYHTTGRSAAISMESYGNATIRALTKVSSAFYKAPPDGFTETPLWAPRGALILADEGMTAKLDARFATVSQIVPTVQRLSTPDILELAPFLHPERWTAALYEPDAFDLDVHAIHGAFLRSFRRNGGEVRREAELVSAARRAGVWTLTLSDGGTLQAATLINAAGAWADEAAAIAGVSGIGLRPLRRSVLLVDPGRDVRAVPYIGTVNEEIFIKPESGRVMVSPCDETESAPCDAWPDDLDVAVAMERFEQATTIQVSHVQAKWAGLRCFVSDRSPVIGADDATDGFFWFAAPGGYGIQAAPGLAALCRSLILKDGVPPQLARLGVTAAAVSPARCRQPEFRQRAVEVVAELR
jgi:D-arginine dehydrogenase